MTTSPDDWVTIGAAARRYRIHPATIRSWARRGVIRHIRHQQRILVHSGDTADAERHWRQQGRHTGRTPRPRRGTPRT